MNQKTLLLLAIFTTVLTMGAGCAKQDATKQTTAEGNTNSSVTISETTTVTTPSEDLEKSITRQKDELFRGYDKNSQDLSHGYPVVFTTTTDPAVRFTKLTNSAGDGMHTTFYFINQTKQKILQVDFDEYGGDFGASGDLTLSLNGFSNAIIQREQDINADKREITYKGLLVNKKLNLIFKNPLIWKPESALKFTVLGVSSDLKQAYFADANGLKQFSYDIVNEKLQEINELPSFMAKPLTLAVVPTNWKTYTNTDYGYSIQYPSTWTVDLTTKDSRGKTLATFLAPGQKNVPHDKTVDIQVSPMTDVSRVDSADYIKSNGKVIISTSPVVVGGVSTDKFITNLNNGYNIAVYVEKNSETYVLGLHNTTSSDKEYIDNFNLMLSSFKFTK